MGMVWTAETIGYLISLRKRGKANDPTDPTYRMPPPYNPAAPITLRQLYVGQILAGAMATGYYFSRANKSDALVAKRCVELADAVIAAEAGIAQHVEEPENELQFQS
jgi:hypothetical protein